LTSQRTAFGANLDLGQSQRRFTEERPTLHSSAHSEVAGLPARAFARFGAPHFDRAARSARVSARNKPRGPYATGRATHDGLSADSGSPHLEAHTQTTASNL